MVKVRTLSAFMPELTQLFRQRWWKHSMSVLPGVRFTDAVRVADRKRTGCGKIAHQNKTMVA
jgi:hypothetical protein